MSLYRSPDLNKPIQKCLHNESSAEDYFCKELLDDFGLIK